MPAPHPGGSRARASCGAPLLAIAGLCAACHEPSTIDADAGSSSAAHDDDGEATVASAASSTHADDAAGSTSGADETHGETSDDGSGESGVDTGGEPAGDELPYDPEQLDAVCERGNADPIALALCSEPAPEITDLVGLYDAIGMTSVPAFFSLVSSSTSIAGRSISVINPRALNFVAFDQGIAAAAFARGDQFVEMVGYDEAADALNFYLLTFFRECDDAEAGCGLADRFLPAVESGWTKWSLYQDLDLENHPLDCLTCHQPAGPGAAKLLLGQESTEPWLHWFPGVGELVEGETQSSILLTPLFLEMHGDEVRYGGLRVYYLAQEAGSASGIVLQNFLDAYWETQGGVPAGHTPKGQPFDFDSAAVEADIAMGSTATWDGYYAQTLAGERLPVPHHAYDITDPDLRAAAVASYADVKAGLALPESLVDPRAVLTAQTEEQLGFRPRAGASAEEILHHVCQRCHNDELDQTLSRAKFNAERPDEIPAAEKLVAIDRLMEPDGSALLMPPRRFATLPDAEKQTLLEWLQQ